MVQLNCQWHFICRDSAFPIPSYSSTTSFFNSAINCRLIRQYTVNIAVPSIPIVNVYTFAHIKTRNISSFAYVKDAERKQWADNLHTINAKRDGEKKRSWRVLSFFTVPNNKQAKWQDCGILQQIICLSGKLGETMAGFWCVVCT